MTIFTDLENIILKFIWNREDAEWSNPGGKKRMKLEILQVLISDYTTKIQ